MTAPLTRASLRERFERLYEPEPNTGRIGVRAVPKHRHGKTASMRACNA